MTLLGACLQLGKIYAGWIVLHYVATHIYVHACVPATLYGFALSPFLATAPHCQALRWVIYEGGNNLNMIWLTLSGGILNWFVFKHKEPKTWQPQTWQPKTWQPQTWQPKTWPKPKPGPWQTHAKIQ